MQFRQAVADVVRNPPLTAYIRRARQHAVNEALTPHKRHRLALLVILASPSVSLESSKDGRGSDPILAWKIHCIFPGATKNYSVGYVQHSHPILSHSHWAWRLRPASPSLTGVVSLR
jgi:hypothetical protein